MTGADFASPVDTFVRPMLGLPAWGVKRGYGSFLTFEFGEPKLHVKDWQSPKAGLQRSADVHGEWHLWIYCCDWRVLRDGVELAWSEEANELIERAAAYLNGQRLIAVEVDAARGRSVFSFDLGASLETWPSGDDATEVQWMILSDAEAFTYRADGHCERETPSGARSRNPA